MLSHFKILISILFFSQGMSTGLQFLSIPASANDLIMFNSPWRNPSFLNTLEKSPELSFAYGKWFADSENISLNWTGNIQSTSTGLNFRYVGINDIELRPDMPTSDPLGHYSSYGISAKALTSFQSGQFRYGVALQVISIQLYQEESSGFAGDLGISWLVNESITLSGSLLNFGKMNELYKEEPTLPQRAISSLSFSKNKSDYYASIELNELIKKVRKLCTPAFLYLALSMLTIFVLLFQNLGNNNKYCMGSYQVNCKHIQ